MTIHWVSRQSVLELALSCIQPQDTWVLGGEALLFVLANPTALARYPQLQTPICLRSDCVDLQPPLHWEQWQDEQLIDAIVSDTEGLIQW